MDIKNLNNIEKKIDAFFEKTYKSKRTGTFLIVAEPITATKDYIHYNTVGYSLQCQDVNHFTSDPHVFCMATKYIYDRELCNSYNIVYGRLDSDMTEFSEEEIKEMIIEFFKQRI